MFCEKNLSLYLLLIALGSAGTSFTITYLNDHKADAFLFLLLLIFIISTLSFIYFKERKEEIDSITLFIVHIILFGLILLSFGLIFYRSVTIDASDKMSGVVSVLSVFFAVLLFYMGMYDNMKRVKDSQLQRQKDLLRSLLVELEFLGNEMPDSNKRESHLTWYKNSAWVTSNFKEPKLPLHPVHKIDSSFYCNKLDDVIDGKSTLDLKRELLLLKDRTFLINFSSLKVININYDPTYDQDTKKLLIRRAIENDTEYERTKSAIEDAILSYRKLKTIINDEFKIIL